MSTKSHFRGPLDKWHGKRAEREFKAERLLLYQIYWSLWRIFRLKKSLWMTWKILGLFVNPLSGDNKYSLINRGNWLQHFQMELSQTRKILSQFFFKFSRFRLNFEHFQKKMNLIADLFLKWQTLKDVVS